MKETYLSFAREILKRNVARMGPDGRCASWKGEPGEFGETSAMIFALGLFFHLTGERRIGAWDVVELAKVLSDRVVERPEGNHEIIRMFLGMGLGYFGGIEAHPVLSLWSNEDRKRVFDELIIEREFYNNWHMFNMNIALSRHLLGLEGVERVWLYFDKLDEIFRANAGYFDDSGLPYRSGAFDIYGPAALQEMIHAAEVVGDLERLRSLGGYITTYLDLMIHMFRPDGFCWPFGRSSGIYGSLTPLVLCEMAMHFDLGRRTEYGIYRRCARVAFESIERFWYDPEKGVIGIREGGRKPYSYRKTLVTTIGTACSLLLAAKYADSRRGIEAPIPSEKKSYCIFYSMQETPVKRGVLVYNQACFSIPLTVC